MFIQTLLSSFRIRLSFLYFSWIASRRAEPTVSHALTLVHMRSYDYSPTNICVDDFLSSTFLIIVAALMTASIALFSQSGSGGYGEHLPVQEALYHPCAGSAGELSVWELARAQRPESAAAAVQRLPEAGRHPAGPRLTLRALQHAVHPQRPGERVLYRVWRH